MARPPVIYAEQSVQLQDILDNIAALSIRATSVLDDADKLLADNSPTDPFGDRKRRSVLQGARPTTRPESTRR